MSNGNSVERREDTSQIRYIAFPKAMKLLNDRLLDVTAEELAAWTFLGTKEHGLVAYTNANELNPPPRFYFGNYTGDEDYLALLMACWFKEEDVERFQPVERFISGKTLVERWSKQLGTQAEAYIRAKIEESRLIDIHPTMGGSQWGGGEAPGEAALFSLSEVQAIEEEDGITPYFSRTQNTPAAREARKNRLMNRVREEKSKGVRAFLEVVAEEEGISVSRLKQIINDQPKAAPANKSLSRNPWSGLQAQSRRTSSKKLKTHE